MEPTNVLIICSDQHARRIAGCYGDSLVQTPNLDALAATGVRFANAYCNSPICVPSRASFATGRYAHALRTWDNASPYTGAEAASWGHRLTEQGYPVTTVGKLHYRHVDDPTGFPDQRLPMHVLEGVGDLYGLLREEMPQRESGRQQVLNARAGESDYTRYDRATAQATVDFLRREAPRLDRPWALFCSLVTPHFPLIAPEPYFKQYPPDTIPLPVGHAVADWPRHPVIDDQRRLQTLDHPFDEPTLRQAMAAYYGLVTFMDDQIGAVLRALAAAGLRDTTRIIYTSDHGEQLGAHGLWFKSSMYEGAVGVPLIIAGPDVPVGQTVTTNVSLVDLAPTIVAAVGAQPAPVDADLPGRDLWSIANKPNADRLVFAEYHAIFATTAIYMLRDARFKYIKYLRYPAQLFDLVADPDETRDLVAEPAHATTVARFETLLRQICDPEAIDREARADQNAKIAAAGGRAAIVKAGARIPFTPAPRH